MPGSIDAQHGHQCRLVASGILARALAQRRGVAPGVEQVVGDLEGSTDQRAETRQAAHLRGACQPQQRASFHRLLQQGAGFHGLHFEDLVHRQRLVAALGLEVECLAARHAAQPRSQRQMTHELAAQRRIVMGGRVGENIERIGEQAVAGEDRGRLVIGLVDRGTSAPQIVVVHRRQVIVHQRIAMDHLQRTGGAHGGFGGDVEQGRGLKRQERPQALAATQRCMAHGCQQAGGSARLAGPRLRRQQTLQRLLDLRRDIVQFQLERNAHSRPRTFPRPKTAWRALWQEASLRGRQRAQWLAFAPVAADRLDWPRPGSPP